MHWFRIITFTGLAYSTILTANLSAGVITVEGGLVTSATLVYGTQEYEFNFVQGSWNDLTSQQQVAIQSGPQWDDRASFGSVSTALAILLAQAMNEAISSDPSLTISTSPSYWFAESTPGDGVWGARTYYELASGYNQYTWHKANWRQDVSQTATVRYGKPIIWAVPNYQETVPEPSTAIAIGIVSIVGVVKSRRRRRQVTIG